MRRYSFALAFLAAVLAWAPPSFAAQPIKTYSSGNVANSAAVATITGTAQQWTYITGFEITYGGATSAACVNATVTGLLGGTATYVVCAPAGVAVSGNVLRVEFVPPLGSAATNTNIVVTLPALGAGNTNAAVVAHGFVE